MKKAFAGLVIFMLPSLVLAAGFAKQSIFLSKSSVTEGDTVLIHAVVENDTAAAFAGSVVLQDGDTKVGSVPVTLDAGEAQAVSVSWKPSGGTHVISAELEAKDGTVVEKQSDTFLIAAKPEPASSASDSAAAVGSSAAIQQQIGNLSPAAENTVAPVFTLIDSARNSAADALDGQLASTKANLSKQQSPADVSGGEVEGAQTVKTPDPLSSAWYVLYTIYFYILTVLRFIVGSAGVFYPLLAIIFFFILWRTFKRFRRPAY